MFELSVLLICIVFAHNVASDLCPDHRSRCSATSTCCELSSGSYGCCPLKDAVCCADHLHCCPNGTTCDLQHLKCVQNDGQTKRIHHNKKVRNLDDEVICPDQHWKCPIGSTCCLLGDKQYGCCPFNDAVCCDDRMHCCPQKTVCDPIERRCTGQDGLHLPWKRKYWASKRIFKKPISNIEPHRMCDSESSCPAAGTCCQSSDEIGSRCCKYRNAVCCPYGDKCCPAGFRCDVDNDGRCVKSDDISFIVKTWQKTSESYHDRGFKHKSCGINTVCPWQNACCPNEHDDGSVTFSCCAVSQGDCCGDGCCPKGYRCLDGKKCEKLVGARKMKHRRSYLPIP